MSEAFAIEFVIDLNGFNNNFLSISHVDECYILNSCCGENNILLRNSQLYFSLVPCFTLCVVKEECDISIQRELIFIRSQALSGLINVLVQAIRDPHRNGREVHDPVKNGNLKIEWRLPS